MILRHFDPECHIRIKTDTSGYAFSEVFSQIFSNHYSSGHGTHKDPSSEIDPWYRIAFFFQKMIPIKTRYKIHNQELLAIIKVFKTWRYYLEG